MRSWNTTANVRIVTTGTLLLPAPFLARAHICVPPDLQDLTTTDAINSDGFGRPVAVIGDRIVVGTFGQENLSPGLIHAGG